MRQTRIVSWALSLLLVGACETTPKPEPVTVAPVARVASYDARSLGRALRRIDALRAQNRGSEVTADPCAGLPDPACAFLRVYASEDRNAAWKEFNAQAKKDPGNALAQLGMQLIYVEWKIDDQAEVCHERAVAADPKLAVAHARLGAAYVRKGDDARARQYFNQALEADPEDGDALLGLARLHVRADEAPQALERYRAAMKAWPELAAAPAEAAALAERLEDMTQAEEFYRQAARSAPRSVEVRRSLAALLVRQGKADDARAVYREAAAIDPKHFPTLLALARLSEQAGDDDAAFEYYRKAGDAKGDELDVQRALGRGYLKRDQLGGAETAFAQVLALAPNDGEAHLALARINLKAQRHSEAVGHFRAALKVQPDEAVSKERAALEKELNISTTPAQGRSVDATFNAALKPILDSYKLRLKKKPKLAGQVTLKVVVDAKGAVTEVKVVEDTLKDEPLMACIYWNVFDARFPEADKARHFTYPLTFAH